VVQRQSQYLIFACQQCYISNFPGISKADKNFEVLHKFN